MGREFTTKVADFLSQWTGQKWQVMTSQFEGEASLQEQENARKEQKIAEISTDPLVASALAQFPGAKLVGVQNN
ncbi:MAG: hypothetical protein EBR02_04125 [Alphaproteobacteria bacterium]|nr:hypothetical protein [Alphaproteobacteria bacterium]